MLPPRSRIRPRRASARLCRLTLLSTESVLNTQKRYLRSDVSTEESGKNSANNEERGIGPASVRIAAKKLTTKDEGISMHGIGAGGEKKRQAKLIIQEYFQLGFRFLVWPANKRTPATMYDRLNDIKTTGSYNKNYRIYISYLRFYEFFKGSTYYPIHLYGPKVQTD
ncbi:hypothetical protein PC128_g24452 [Phytophthora cactorum]|nr:hypothetical protein PC128_g24452 [Phytophthora cactorum]KAG4045150.1 hypothetical protein PC123_g19432 [Phytophthora cactorum]